MNKIAALLLLLITQASFATQDKTQLAVWANEAIIATYTFDYKSYLQEQKEIAKYFTSQGWINYSKALNDSKLPESIQKNMYEVSAVATHPPILNNIDSNHWQVTMPILVVYKNPQYEQQQQLKVQLGITTAPAGQGVRGFAITSLKSLETEAPCKCSKTPSKQETAPP